ncbi:alpha/beta hydrolase [Desulfonema ishimotonii]|uniref:Alpha/beta hydrolase n=1 Tax=Desulfonema ishimotonii TaxID=45657 RepID=A0A401FRS8_9BACT|nr:alpha/beta fold hydrolase [Desulfonema ishimotonii]GBC59665.1 alpha/beta hydrolase [Desulfonema ishimotonii]
MPLISHSDYRPPALLGNGHLQTIYPSLFRKVPGIRYCRERIPTPDGDFIDLDHSPVGSGRAVIISHGLEGHTDRSYVKGMVRAFNRCGWDAVAWNFRGCSGQPNRLLRSYHSGATDDLHTVVCHLLDTRKYDALALIGFSVGGNITLKYAGEKGRNLSPRIRCAATVSVPCDLKACARKLAETGNTLYMKRFLLDFREKIREKMAIMPGRIDDRGFEAIRTFTAFDNRYTAPLNGFADASEYYAQCSSGPFIPDIARPTLLISARNDPFLTPACFPVAEAANNPYFFLEIPASGGHVGFIRFNSPGEYWHETRIVSFVTAHV